MLDAYRHVPSLRGRITPPERSLLRVTREVLSEWDERARQMGRLANWRLSDEELERSRRTLLGTVRPQEDLWIYSYGSLMWDPGFHFVEIRLAVLEGYERRFCHRTTMGRGSPDRPALMLSLQPSAGACAGLAFRIDAPHAEAESAIVWRREMVRGSYKPAFLPVRTPQGDITALTFGPNPAHPDFVGELPLDETAAVIARGSGVLGSNMQYLELLAAQLASVGIQDEYMAKLLLQVRAHGPA